MIKQITMYETEDGTSFRDKDQAIKHERNLRIRAILRKAIPQATNGLHGNIHQFFIDNIDAICVVTDEYRNNG